MIPAFLAPPLFAALLAASTPSDEAVRLERELISGTSRIGTEFVLADPKGRKRSLADFHGKVVVLYFGYTFCPDVCPTDLQQVARAMKLLGRNARKVQPLFVTLDPARDTPKLLGQYVRAFHPRIVALRGSEEETRRIARAFKIYYERAPQPGKSGYTIDHAAYTILLGRDGRYAGYIPPGTPGGRTAVMIEELLDGP
ncbi:MAG TPA: SCO family protein [Usitatibacter sp.]|nr:SCO family protein [Usitatibacter sp.]